MTPARLQRFLCALISAEDVFGAARMALDPGALASAFPTSGITSTLGLAKGASSGQGLSPASGADSMRRALGAGVDLSGDAPWAMAIGGSAPGAELARDLALERPVKSSDVSDAVARRGGGAGPMAHFEHAVARLERLAGGSVGAGRAGRRLTLPVGIVGESLGARRSAVRPPVLRALALTDEKPGQESFESRPRSVTDEQWRELLDVTLRTQNGVQALLARPRRAVFG